MVSLVFGPARNAFPQRQMGAPSASAVTPQRLGTKGHDREHECRSRSEIFIAVPTEIVGFYAGTPKSSGFVRHEPNAPSGGHQSDIDIGTFLTRGPLNPEHQALLRLIATLVAE